jgi:hypothetical protein
MVAQQEEIRMSIFFGGGSYYLDDEQSVSLSRWLDSIPNLLDKYEIQLIMSVGSATINGSLKCAVKWCLMH